MNNDETIALLMSLIEEEYSAYLDECDLDEDRGIDPVDFAKHASENITTGQGPERFQDYNIFLIAESVAEEKAARCECTDEEDYD